LTMQSFLIGKTGKETNSYQKPIIHEAPC
jgi:hypothetical protein